MAGLLDNMTPNQYGLLAAGLGMMGNSRGRSLGEALSAGGVQGVNAMQAMQQQQFDNQRAQQEYELSQMKLQQMRDSDYLKSQARSAIKASGGDINKIQQALFDAGLFEDAIKLKRGTGLGGGDYQFISGPNGKIIIGDKNAGSLKYGDINGEQAVMGVYDPTTQGNVAREKSLNKWETVETPTGAKQSGIAKDLVAPTMPMSKADEQAAIQRLNSQPSALTTAEYNALTSPTVTGLTPEQQKEQEEKGKAAAEAQQSLNNRLLALQSVLDEADLGIKALDAKFDKNGNVIGYGFETGGLFPGLREWGNETIFNDPRYRDISTAAAGGKLKTAIDFLKGQGQITEGERALVGEQVGIDAFKQSSKNNYDRLMRVRGNAKKSMDALRNSAKGDFSEVKELTDEELLKKYR